VVPIVGNGLIGHGVAQVFATAERDGQALAAARMEEQFRHLRPAT
jgi:hypothetical protein